MRSLSTVTAMTTTAYSQGYAPSVLASQTWRTVDNSATHLLPHLRPGQTVLDVAGSSCPMGS